MDRGSFNGPGGPHRRWVVPAAEGAAMPAGFMLRNRLRFGFVSSAEVLQLSREGLACSGPAVAEITARAVAPAPGQLAGITVRLDGASPRTGHRPATRTWIRCAPGLRPLIFTPWKPCSVLATIRSHRTMAC